MAKKVVRDTQNTPNREELINMAARAAKQGQRKGARMMLQKVLAEDKRNERAMMMMAKLAGSKASKRKWLNRILQVNPDNEKAIEALDKMDYDEQAARNMAIYRIAVVSGVVAILALSIIVVVGAALGARI